MVPKISVFSTQHQQASEGVDTRPTLLKQTTLSRSGGAGDDSTNFTTNDIPTPKDDTFVATVPHARRCTEAAQPESMGDVDGWVILGLGIVYGILFLTALAQLVRIHYYSKPWTSQKGYHVLIGCVAAGSCLHMHLWRVQHPMSMSATAYSSLVIFVGVCGLQSDVLSLSLLSWTSERQCTST